MSTPAMGSHRRQQTAVCLADRHPGLLLAALGGSLGWLWGGSSQFFPWVCSRGFHLGRHVADQHDGGESVLLSSANAREVSHEQAPQLYNIVEEMRISAALPAMPRVYIIDTPVPNAFAVGLKPERACVAVTTGLLERLNRDEL